MLNKREIWEICKKLLNMISDSMLHFFALYVFMTGFNTLYCIQHDKQTAMEIVKDYYEYTLLMSSLVWILVCLIFMYDMKKTKVFTSLALWFLQISLSVVQKIVGNIFICYLFNHSVPIVCPLNIFVYYFFI